MFGDILLIIFSFALLISGALGIILPLLPSMPLAWLGMLAFAIATDFLFITWKILFIFLAFVVFSFILDFIIPLIGAKQYHASRYGVIGSIIGMIIGILFFGPLGIIVGPFLGTFIGEMVWGKNQDEAMKSAKGIIIGFLAGSAIKFSIILVMLGFMIYALVLLI